MCLPARLVSNEATGMRVSTCLRSTVGQHSGGHPLHTRHADGRSSVGATTSDVIACRGPAARCTSLRAEMARRSLRPELNRIRAWVRQGRTDAWIAHQLEVTVQQIQAFKREQGLEPNGDPETGAGVDFDDEIDLRAEDDALIAAELEAAEAERAR